MKAHVVAVARLVETVWPFDIYYGDVGAYDVFEQRVPSITYPYVLLWSSAGRLLSDEVCGTPDDLNDLIGVTTVAADAMGCLTAVGKVREALIGKAPAVAGRHTQRLRLFASEQIRPDESVRLPDTNTYPVYAVDQYRLISEPEEGP